MSCIKVTASSWRGCVRSKNEDMILVDDRFIRNDRYDKKIFISDSSRFVIAVADGMGGCNAGEVASAETLANLQFFVKDLPEGLNSDDFMRLMSEWLESINKVISSKGSVDSRLNNMGTTLVAIVCYDGRFFWMNCGDSRMYRLHEDKLSQITTDHSLDRLTGANKHSNIVTNCIGAGCTTSYMDINEFTSDIHRGDVYLLCSDGLNDMITNSEIEALLVDGGIAENLCKAAIEAGGFDNVSVCVIEIV